MQTAAVPGRFASTRTPIHSGVALVYVVMASATGVMLTSPTGIIPISAARRLHHHLLMSDRCNADHRLRIGSTSFLTLECHRQSTSFQHKHSICTVSLLIYNQWYIHPELIDFHTPHECNSIGNRRLLEQL